MKCVFKIIKKIFMMLGSLYAALFAVFFFDLDGKLLYRVVEPFMTKHFDSMERRDPLSVPYNTDTPNYEYKV